MQEDHGNPVTRSLTSSPLPGHIRIKLNSELPVQVDGEPWNQAPGEVVVLKSALKVTLSHAALERRGSEGWGRGGVSGRL